MIELEELKAHEDVDSRYIKELEKDILADKILKFAIVVDKNTNIILDGNHRFSILRGLECKEIPAVLVDYNSPQIQVQSWRNDWEATKKKVIEAGLSLDKLPPKTSKHMIKIDGRLEHVFVIEKLVGFPLVYERAKFGQKSLNLPNSNARINTMSQTK